MTDECITPLRQRMIEDMSLRNFGEKTQKDYIRAVKNLTIFLHRSPDTASNEDLRLFQLRIDTMLVRWFHQRAAVGKLLFHHSQAITMEEKAHDHPSDSQRAGAPNRGDLVCSF
jgi:hypothetical protein